MFLGCQDCTNCEEKEFLKCFKWDTEIKKIKINEGKTLRKLKSHIKCTNFFQLDTCRPTNIFQLEMCANFFNCTDFFSTRDPCEIAQRQHMKDI